MKVLIACEESQEVCKAFRAKGHEAFSCDLLPCSGGHPEWHIQDDVTNHLTGYDLIIAFPPCTDLAVSGARWFKDKNQQPAIDFFMMFTRLTCKWAIENPIGIMSTKYRKPDQIIQPWWFGHKETKATCLWLNNLPLLTETSNVKKWMDLEPDSVKHRVHRMPPSADRAKLRSKTYTGIAKAMAQFWLLTLVLLSSCTRYYTVSPATITIKDGKMNIKAGAARVIKDTVIYNSFIINKH